MDATLVTLSEVLGQSPSCSPFLSTDLSVCLMLKCKHLWCLLAVLGIIDERYPYFTGKLVLLVFKLIICIIPFFAAETEATSKSKTNSTQNITPTTSTFSGE